VIEASKPTDETVDAIKDWLFSEGVSRGSIVRVKETSRLTYLGSNSIENVTHSDNKGWIAFNAPASMVEGLLHTEFHEHHDLESGNVVPSCDQYHVPRYMQHHIDFITPGIKLIGKATAEFSGTATEMHKRHGHWQPKPPLRSHRHPFPHPWPHTNLSICDEEITPACLQALYQFPPGE
jgi:tripeptidyl-peptidase-1